MGGGTGLANAKVVDELEGEDVEEFPDGPADGLARAVGEKAQFLGGDDDGVAALGDVGGQLGVVGGGVDVEAGEGQVVGLEVGLEFRRLLGDGLREGHHARGRRRLGGGGRG